MENMLIDPKHIQILYKHTGVFIYGFKGWKKLNTCFTLKRLLSHLRLYHCHMQNAISLPPWMVLLQVWPETTNGRAGSGVTVYE